MRHAPIHPQLFVHNRERLRARLKPGALAFLNANDIPVTNADGTLANFPNSDLFYLSGVEQEQSVLAIFPDAPREYDREVLFVRETSALLQIWEGAKLTKDQAATVSGISEVRWLSELPSYLHSQMPACTEVYLNSNEHARAEIETPSRDARFIASLQESYPLHNYHRLAPILAGLRAEKSEWEIELLRRACGITREGFIEVLKMLRPGVMEFEIEATLSAAYLSRRGKFAYTPIIASGANSCVLHYLDNDQRCESGELLLMDVASSYANYNADLTRTVPVSGKFSDRQRSVYEVVLRVMRDSIERAQPGTSMQDWQEAAELQMNDELLKIGLITIEDIRRETKRKRACRKYFMHGLGHSLGLDIHDITPPAPVLQAGWVITVEPGVYIPDEGFGVRLENDVLITDQGPVDLMHDIPVEPDEIEELMARWGGY